MTYVWSNYIRVPISQVFSSDNTICDAGVASKNDDEPSDAEGSFPQEGPSASEGSPRPQQQQTVPPPPPDSRLADFRQKLEEILTCPLTGLPLREPVVYFDVMWYDDGGFLYGETVEFVPTKNDAPPEESENVVVPATTVVRKKRPMIRGRRRTNILSGDELEAALLRSHAVRNIAVKTVRELLEKSKRRLPDRLSLLRPFRLLRTGSSGRRSGSRNHSGRYKEQASRSSSRTAFELQFKRSRGRAGSRLVKFLAGRQRGADADHAPSTGRDGGDAETVSRRRGDERDGDGIPAIDILADMLAAAAMSDIPSANVVTPPRQSRCSSAEQSRAAATTRYCVHTGGVGGALVTGCRRIGGMLCAGGGGGDIMSRRARGRIIARGLSPSRWKRAQATGGGSSCNSESSECEAAVEGADVVVEEGVPEPSAWRDSGDAETVSRRRGDDDEGAADNTPSGRQENRGDILADNPRASTHSSEQRLRRGPRRSRLRVGFPRHSTPEPRQRATNTSSHAISRGVTLHLHM